MVENMNTTPSPIQFQFKIPFGFNLINIQGLPTPFAYRPGTSDEPVIKSIFQFQEYALNIKDFQLKLILDCGGNIGCSAVYFANKYPDAQIYSIEPEKNNFQLLKFNTCLYENIHGIQSALWDKKTFIKVEDVGLDNWGFMTFETTADDPDAFQTTTISKIFKDSGFEEIDLLKVDIEGAEKEVFGAADVDE